MAKALKTLQIWLIESQRVTIMRIIELLSNVI